MIEQIKALIAEQVVDHQLQQQKRALNGKDWWFHQGAIEALEKLSVQLDSNAMPVPQVHGSCKHPYVWPDGKCIHCEALATTMPSSSSRQHLMVPRDRAHVLWEFRREARKALRFELADCIRAVLECIGYNVVARDKREGGSYKP